MNHQTLLVHTVLVAQKAGLHWHYCKDSRICEGSRGFPDLFVVGQHGAAFIELKTADDDTTAEQDGWAYFLHLNEITCKLFRPNDLTDGTIRRFMLDMA